MPKKTKSRKSRSRKSRTLKRSTKKPRRSPAASATLYKEGTKKKGTDGNTWIITVTSNGIKRWTKHRISSKKSSKKTTKKSDTKEDSKDLVNKIHKKLFYKIYKMWSKLSSGALLVINKDGTNKMVTSKKIKEYMTSAEDDPKVLKMVWSSISSDTLYFFVNYILNKASLTNLEDMCTDPLKELVKNHKLYFDKYYLETSKDYTFKSVDKLQYNKVYNKIKKSSKLTKC